MARGDDFIKIAFGFEAAGHHVDHIIPLKGVVIDGADKWRISGLHALHNLQYLDQPSNHRKYNNCFQIE